MFLNKKNGKLYPDYRDKCFVDKNGNKCYWVPKWFQDQGFPKYIVFEDWDRFYTKKQLEKKKLQPVEGYYGMKWYTNSKMIMQRYYFDIECTEPLKKDGDANPKQ